VAGGHEFQVGLIAAGSAVAGGFLSAMAGVRVEKLRQRSATCERVELRRVAAVQRFATAAFAWFDWLGVLENGSRIERHARLDENNRRSLARQQAYRELLLLCSDQTFAWLQEFYEPLEYRVRRHVVRPLLDGEPLADEGRSASADYDTFLRRDLILRLRPEVAVLRADVPAGNE